MANAAPAIPRPAAPPVAPVLRTAIGDYRFATGGLNPRGRGPDGRSLERPTIRSMGGGVPRASQTEHGPVLSASMLNKIRETVKRRILESREKRAGRIARDAAARGDELRERGKTGATSTGGDDPGGRVF
jgi:hypothetical protein